jgi:hypothetical protein
LDQVKTEICRAVALYADNYSDEFKLYAPQFALTIWSLLTKLNLSSSYDEVSDFCSMYFFQKLGFYSWLVLQ